MAFSNLRNKINSLFIKSLSEEGSKIVEKAKQNASWSSRIPNAISLGQAEKTNRGFEIVIKVDASEDGPAPHAAAFEYGSGEHSTRGEKKRYVIAPKDSDLLAFDWKPQQVPWGSPKFFGAILEDPDSTAGRYFFHFVEHPGVKPKPYLQPAIDSERGKLRSKLARVIKQAYAESVVKVEVISA